MESDGSTSNLWHDTSYRVFVGSGSLESYSNDYLYLSDIAGQIRSIDS